MHALRLKIRGRHLGAKLQITRLNIRKRLEVAEGNKDSPFPPSILLIVTFRVLFLWH